MKTKTLYTSSLILGCLCSTGTLSAATLQIALQNNADFATFVDGAGPFVIDDLAATVDGVDITFDLTLTGTGGTPAGNIFFTQNRPRMDLDAADSDIKGLTLVISDIQGAVTFEGFIDIDRFDNSGGDPWDVNGETISATGNTVALSPATINATKLSQTLAISQLANTAGGSNGATRLEGFTLEFTAVPEPSSTALLGLGGLAVLLRRRR